MKKMFGMALILALVGSMMAPTSTRGNEGTGGAPAFFIGCCFGLRVGTQWNEGVDLHWREWASVIPGFNIWNGIECLNGLTGKEFAEMHGANWY